jgi:hypothetical protein
VYRNSNNVVQEIVIQVIGIVTKRAEKVYGNDTRLALTRLFVSNRFTWNITHNKGNPNSSKPEARLVECNVGSGG